MKIETVLRYHSIGNIIPIGENKRPLTEWKRWCTERQTEDDIKSFNWNAAKGVGIISGINDIHLFDLDKVEDISVIYKVIQILGFPKEYSWTICSGSGKGYHIYFRCSSELPAHLIGRVPSGNYKLKPKDPQLLDHLELRWKDCQTLLPPSMHPSGQPYTFLHNEPGGPPHETSVVKIIDAIKELCVVEGLEEPVNDSKQYVNMAQDGFIEVLDIDTKELENAVNAISGKINSYDEWYRVGFSLASLGEDGRKHFIKISSENPNYKDTVKELNWKFDSFLKNKRNQLSIGTLFHIAENYGYKRTRIEAVRDDDEEWSEERPFTGEKKAKTKIGRAALKVEQYLIEKYDFKHNKLTDKIEWRSKQLENDYRELTNDDIGSLYFRIQKQVTDFSKDNLILLLYSEFTPKYNPILDYFNKLPSWDEKEDYIYDLSMTVMTDDVALWPKYFRKWIVGVVACALSDRISNDPAIIFQGDQGVGKTRWIHRLVPEPLKNYIYTGSIDPKDKDSKFNIVSNFLINLDELETAARGEIGHLKSLMTQKYLQLRRPYGRLTENYIRRSSFIGSVNKTEFLNDPTGGRRFLTFSTSTILYEHDINIDGVWTQALHLFRNKERYWFAPDEIKEINARNDIYRFKTKEESLVAQKFSPIDNEKCDGAEIMTTSDIAQKLMGDSYSNSNLYLIGQSLKTLGFVQKNIKMNGIPRRYWIVKKNESNDTSFNNDKLPYKDDNLF